MPAGDFSTASAPVAVSVLYFAALRDLTGTSEERVSVAAPAPATGRDGAQVSEVDVSLLLATLEDRHSSLRGRLQSVRVAVDEEFVELSTRLHGGEVVALIPPVSGG